MRAWVEKITPYNPNEYSAMRKGREVPEHYCRAVINCLRLEVHSERDKRILRLFEEFLGCNGLTNPSSRTNDEILAVVCGRPITPKKKSSFGDAFRDIYGLLHSAAETWQDPIATIDFCQEPEDVYEAVRWIFIELGRSVGGPELPQDEAVIRGKERIGVSYEEYRELALAWKRQHPWTVVFARNGTQRVGMTIALPLTLKAYEAVLRGERMTYRCLPNELQPTSSTILVEACTLCPAEDCASIRAPTKHLVFAMICQQAFLSYVPEITWNEPLRLLAVAGTDENRKRAEFCGYRMTNQKLPGMDVDILERQLSLKASSLWHPMDAACGGIWRHLQWKLWDSWTKISQSTGADGSLPFSTFGSA